MSARASAARIGIASMSLGSGFQGQMYSLLKKQLRPGDEFVECSMVLEKTPEHQRERLMGLLEGSPRPTAVIGLCLRPDASTVDAYRSAGIPIVLIDEQVAGTSTVACDNYAGGLLAARHLVMIGRRSAAIVTGHNHREGDYNAERRLQGFTKGLVEAGLALPPDRVVRAPNYSRKEGTDAMKELLEGGRPVDGVFCAAGDVCATGVVAAARLRGMNVPDQLAVIGYDDNPVAAQADLTTLRQPLEAITAAAYAMAIEEARQLLDHPRNVLLEPALVARGSTQSAAAGSGRIPVWATATGR